MALNKQFNTHFLIIKSICEQKADPEDDENLYELIFNQYLQLES